MNTVTRVLAVANQKGGVAKTTTVASLGAAMEEKGRRVLLVDLDPQGCLTFSLGQDPDKLAVSIHDVLLGEVEPDAALVDTSEGMTLLPANIDLAGAEAMLLMRAGREYALKRALAKIGGKFDVVIIDCPPSLGVLTLNGLTAADDVIVPLQCETLAHRGVGQFLRTITDVQQITNSDLKLLGALPTLYDSRTTHSRDVLLDVADRYDLPVLAPPIPRTVRFAEASASGASVLAEQEEQGRDTPTASWPPRCSSIGRAARRWPRSRRRSDPDARRTPLTGPAMNLGRAAYLNRHDDNRRQISSGYRGQSRHRKGAGCRSPEERRDTRVCRYAQARSRLGCPHHTCATRRDQCGPDPASRGRRRDTRRPGQQRRHSALRRLERPGRTRTTPRRESVRHVQRDPGVPPVAE